LPLAEPLALVAVVLCIVLPMKAARAQYFSDDRNSCRSCHVDAKNKTDFCDLFEATIYEKDDKHGKAFFLLHETDLNDPRKGQEKRDLVRQILGFDLREAFADDRYTHLKPASDEEAKRKLAMVKACLRCHATWPVAADVQSPARPPVALELGVSCQACHGPGVKWNVPHYYSSHAWRVVTPEAKAALGFADVRTSTKKALLCASCHVGNVAEQKLVKHEWYATGHPPLPSFELSAFEAQMPVHWKPLAMKKDFALRTGSLAREDAEIAGNLQLLQSAGIPNNAIKDNYLQANTGGRDVSNDLPQTKDAIVAGAVVLAAYAKLIGDYAALAAEQQATWPELALYDCAACHHELRSGPAANLRPKRNHAPGRPPLAAWPLVLAKLAVHQAADYDAAKAMERWSSLQGQLQQLDQSATTRPFGDAAAMRDAAKALAAGIFQLADAAADSRFDRAAATKAIEQLTALDHNEINDFSSARQAACAIRAMSIDLGWPDANRLFSRGTDDPLSLDLPSGPNRSVMENLGRWLPAAAHYDAKWFSEEVKAVNSKLRAQ
jgi:nitrate/TMAO reductase-like tetraheme cytochrome c subunit